MVSQEGRICMVTGANSGLGKATTAGLAKLGAAVVMVCRDRVRGEAAQAEIRQAGGGFVELMLADLSDQASVRGLVEEFRRAHDRLHVLVNNAAVFTPQRQETKEGQELMFATNHLGPFLLTNLLLDALKAGAPARVITISAPSTTEINFDDLQGERDFRPFQAFGASKTANLLFTYALAKRLEGTGVTANVVHPGVFKSGLMRNASGAVRLMTGIVGKSPERAAEAVAHVATSPELQAVTGRFFKGRTVSESSAYSRDLALQERLWEGSERLTGL